MITATAINLDILTFWELTPFEFILTVNAYKERTKAEYDQAITMAYITAYWTNQWQSKRKPPSLEKILNTKKEKKTMSDSEMFQQVKVLHKLFGGE